jgi:hypothetical protein
MACTLSPSCLPSLVFFGSHEDFRSSSPWFALGHRSLARGPVCTQDAVLRLLENPPLNSVASSFCSSYLTEPSQSLPSWLTTIEPSANSSRKCLWLSSDAASVIKVRNFAKRAGLGKQSAYRGYGSWRVCPPVLRRSRLPP